MGCCFAEVDTILHQIIEQIYTPCRAQDGQVIHSGWVRRDEGHRREQLPRLQQRSGGEEYAEHVDAHHHLRT